MIVLDASVLIGFFNANDKFHSQAKNILTHAVTNGAGLGVSPFTLAEFYVGPARQGQIEAARTQLARVGIIAVPLQADFSLPLARVRVATNLKMPDACVLLTAQQVATQDQTATLATFDHQLAAAARSYDAPFLVYDEQFQGT